jgi:hypothetical protein
VAIPEDVRAYNRALIEEFRANGRRLGDRPPFFADHQAGISRGIPVVSLVRLL